jgi:hypothetical protein
MIGALACIISSGIYPRKSVAFAESVTVFEFHGDLRATALFDLKKSYKETSISMVLFAFSQSASLLGEPKASIAIVSG